MTKEIYVTILEVDNQECPNIGTIYNSSGTESELIYKYLEALSDYFDIAMEDIHIQKDLVISDVRNSVPIDTVVTIDDQKYNIQIQQTFLY